MIYTKKEAKILYNSTIKVRNRSSDMTYILGAKCVDGIVMVSDTCVTIDDGARFSYAKKLFKPLSAVVMGASGISGLYRSFQDRMCTEITALENKGEQFSHHSKFSIVAENVIRQMHEIYGQDRGMILQGLNVLMAVRVNPQGELINFTSYGIPQPINDIQVIGHGEPYGALFINQFWDKSFTMERTAKLALFVIKLIKDIKLDNTVGFEDKCLPQVFYIPNVIFPTDFEIKAKGKTEEEIERKVNDVFAKYPIRELTDSEIIQLLDSISSTKANLMEFLKPGKFNI